MAERTKGILIILFYQINFVMKDNPINDQPIDVFIIIAVTLDKWQNPSSDAGHSVLMEHYKWGAELKAKNKLLMAGPIDFDLTSTHQIDPIGHTTGLIILNVASREEAQDWANRDPFQIHGYRKNVVHSMKISMTENNLLQTLKSIKK